MKKALILVLTAAMLIGCLCGCSLLGGVKLDELVGTWTITMEDTEEEAMALLENIEAYDEEIALADLDSLEYVQVVKFYDDKSYSFGYDVDGTMACVRDYYDRFFDNLYNGRANLSGLYEVDIANLTRADFQQFYAELYGCADYEDMLDWFAQIAYDYEALEELWETGTFTISGDHIMCTITGTTKEEALGVEVDGNTLTLTYIDGVEVYTKN